MNKPLETTVVESTSIPVVFNITDARIEEMRAECTGLVATDKKSYDHLRKALGVVRTARTEIEKRRKFLKEDALTYGRRIDAMAKELTARVVSIEDPLKAEADRYEKEQERIRYEKENAERLALEAEQRAKREAEEARLKAAREAEEARLAEQRRLFEAERAKALEEQRIERERLAKIEADQLAERKRLQAIQDEIDAKQVKPSVAVVPYIPQTAEEAQELINEQLTEVKRYRPAPVFKPEFDPNVLPHSLILLLIQSSDALDKWVEGCDMDGEHPAMEAANELNNCILTLITDSEVGDSQFAANNCNWNCFSYLRTEKG